MSSRSALATVPLGPCDPAGRCSWRQVEGYMAGNPPKTGGWLNVITAGQRRQVGSPDGVEGWRCAPGVRCVRGRAITSQETAADNASGALPAAASSQHGQQG